MRRPLRGKHKAPLLAWVIPQLAHRPKFAPLRAQHLPQFAPIRDMFFLPYQGGRFIRGASDTSHTTVFSASRPVFNGSCTAIIFRSASRLIFPPAAVRTLFSWHCAPQVGSIERRAKKKKRRAKRGREKKEPSIKKMKKEGAFFFKKKEGERGRKQKYGKNKERKKEGERGLSKKAPSKLKNKKEGAPKKKNGGQKRGRILAPSFLSNLAPGTPKFAPLNGLTVLRAPIISPAALIFSPAVARPFFSPEHNAPCSLGISPLKLGIGGN